MWRVEVTSKVHGVETDDRFIEFVQNTADSMSDRLKEQRILDAARLLASATISERTVTLAMHISVDFQSTAVVFATTAARKSLASSCSEVESAEFEAIELVRVA